MQCYLGLILADMGTLFFSFGVTGYLYLGRHGLDVSLVLAQLLLPVFLTIALYNGSY